MPPAVSESGRSKSSAASRRPRKAATSASLRRISLFPDTRQTRASSSIALPQLKKQCFWMCGRRLGDWDEDENATLKSAYPNGLGGCCWECERVWQTQVAHTTRDRNRANHQGKMAKCKKVFDAFRAKVTEFKERRKKGFTRHCKAEGVKNLKLKTAKISETILQTG